MENRNRRRELSEDLRTHIVEKHQQHQGYKSISRDLNVPLSTVRNIIKKFTTHGTTANLPGHGRKRKMDERLQRRIVRMVDKQPQTTSKEIQAVLQAHGTSVSARTIRRRLNEMKRYGRRPRRTPLLTQTKELDCSLPKCMRVNLNPSGKPSCGQMRPRVFW